MTSSNCIILFLPILMKIASLLAGPASPPYPSSCITKDDLILVYHERMEKAGFTITHPLDHTRRHLTHHWIFSDTVPNTSSHFKVISRHNSSHIYRCNLGCKINKRSPIPSNRLSSQMRMVTIFFRRGDDDDTVLPQFLVFPSWLLHIFRYTQHGHFPGRCDIRFIEDASMAKDDQLFRLNNVINILFRFDIDHIDRSQIEAVIGLSNHLAQLNLDQPIRPPRRTAPASVHHLYADLVELLNQPRPFKLQPACLNCAIKPASRRRLCVACYRYQLKHNAAPPMRLIVANRSISRYAVNNNKKCNNCGVEKTHQWYRNMLGKGHWCETCKSYYIRNHTVRPPKLFQRAAKRRIDFRKVLPN
ncbi:hypothetical protein Unana1_04671 [Umbelopsis nana]